MSPTRRFAVPLASALCTAQALCAGTLAARSDGGWETVGLPYAVRVSPQGQVQSLRIGDIEFVAAPGLRLLDAGEPIPFTSARVVRDVLVAGNDKGELRLRFLPDRIEIVGNNRALSHPDALRLALSGAIDRVKHAESGLEIALPLRKTSGRLRLLAPAGTGLTLPRASRLAPRNGGYLAALPGLFPASGGLAACAIEINAAPLVEDQVRVSVSCARPDHTSWNGTPLTFTTAFTGLGAPFAGTALLRIKAYLTKETVRELRQPLAAPQDGAHVLTWTLADLKADGAPRDRIQ